MKKQNVVFFYRYHLVYLHNSLPKSATQLVSQELFCSKEIITCKVAPIGKYVGLGL